MVQQNGGDIRRITGASSGLRGIISTMNTLEQHSKVPPQHVGNADTGDVNFVSGITTFTAYAMSIKQSMQVIDSFFDMFGYKVNLVKTPNIHKRVNWDYIKCIDVNLEGNIPEKDLNTKIRSLFNNGCTFWHNTSTFLNYSISNGII